MDSLSPSSPIQEVVFIKGAQVGGTEAGNNWIGYVIDYAPGPMMSIQPTVSMAERNSKQRIAPLIDETPKLRVKVRDSRAKESGSTTLEKDFPGGRLVMTGANSATGLRSMPARYMFLDEIDGYPDDVDGEGDPIDLAEARCRTFSRRKILKVSTPTTEGRSKIQRAYDASDKRRYWVPCPHCKEFQFLKWGQMKWPSGDPSKVRYVCEHCEKQIDEHHKTRMLELGEWRAEEPGAGGGKIAGFHLNSLYSPVGWFSWGDAAKAWEKAQKNHLALKSFVNTVLGETWKERGEAPEWQRLYHRREQYPIGTVPLGGIFITAGVDVQKDRLEAEIVAWGRGKESWSVDYRVMPGDTATEVPWLALDALLNEQFLNTRGEYLPIKAMAIDTGFQTQQVYTWARRHPISRVFPVKGREEIPVVVGQPTAVDLRPDGKRIRRGVRIWPVGVSVIKSELYSWLRLEKPTNPTEMMPAGFLHFPEYGEDYFLMLTAEQIIAKVVKGFRKYHWEKIRDRNESLDCRVYARAAASILGIDRYNDRHWDQMDPLGANRNKVTKPVPASSPSPVPQVASPRRRSSSFWNR
jgi:phage terminase large subunit GpA-like protein